MKDLFNVIKGAYLKDGDIIRPPKVQCDMVDAPACGYWTVTWHAEHPERGMETGVMLVSKITDNDPFDAAADAEMARQMVAEVLWGRGYIGNYRSEVVG